MRKSIVFTWEFQHQGRRYGGGVRGVWYPLASEAVGKFLKYRLLSVNVGLSVVSKKHRYSYLFADSITTSIVTGISQHRMYSTFIPMRKRCQQIALK